MLEGPQTAVKTLQTALGVGADGGIGSETEAAAGRQQPKLLLTNYYRECMRHLRTKPGWAAEGLGWECRQMAASLEGAA